jgi:hypothetical protein
VGEVNFAGCVDIFQQPLVQAICRFRVLHPVGFEMKTN